MPRTWHPAVARQPRFIIGMLMQTLELRLHRVEHIISFQDLAEDNL